MANRHLVEDKTSGISIGLLGKVVLGKFNVGHHVYQIFNLVMTIDKKIQDLGLSMEDF